MRPSKESRAVGRAKRERFLGLVGSKQQKTDSLKAMTNIWFLASFFIFPVFAFVKKFFRSVFLGQLGQFFRSVYARPLIPRHSPTSLHLYHSAIPSMKDQLFSIRISTITSIHSTWFAVYISFNNFYHIKSINFFRI